MVFETIRETGHAVPVMNSLAAPCRVIVAYKTTDGLRPQAGRPRIRKALRATEQRQHGRAVRASSSDAMPLALASGDCYNYSMWQTGSWVVTWNLYRQCRAAMLWIEQ